MNLCLWSLHWKLCSVSPLLLVCVCVCINWAQQFPSAVSLHLQAGETAGNKKINWRRCDSWAGWINQLAGRQLYVPQKGRRGFALIGQDKNVGILDFPPTAVIQPRVMCGVRSALGSVYFTSAVPCGIVHFLPVFRSVPPPPCTGFLSISRLVNLAKRSCAGRYFSCDSPIKTSRVLHSSVIKRVLSGWSVRVTVSDGTKDDPWPLRGHDPVQGDAARKGWQWKKESVCVCVWNVCQVIVIDVTLYAAQILIE